MNHLRADECRCHDAGCPERETCLRWVDREYGDPREVYPHSPSLKSYERPLSDPCDLRIDVGRGS